MSLISFNNISKSFGKRLVLSSVNLKIERNELFGLVGRSGSGKSTLLKILTGFYKPTAGEIIFENKDLTGKSKELKKSIGFATQDNAFYEDMTVYENMVYYCRMHGISGNLKEYIKGLLRSVELEGSENVISGKLSGGMKRRLDLAISILHDPDIVVMDEPSSNLDPLLRKEIWRIIQSIKNLGKTVIVASHMFNEISTYCDRACILSKGSIVQYFDLNQLRESEDVLSISDKMEAFMDNGRLNV